MCGIVGCVGRPDETLDVLMHGLSKLEYRGYDSAGVALANSAVEIEKHEGELANLERAVESDAPAGPVGIGHTRWSTHGPPSDRNSHPHADCEGEVAVIHNGIIENFQEVKDELTAAGHEFTSDTDTEVVPHLIESALADGASNEEAFRAAIERIEGSYAIAAVFAGGDSVFCTRQDSPLVLGIDDDATYLASDVPAFREFTDRVVYLEDGEFARIDADGWNVSTADGESVEKTIHTVNWDAEETGKSGYDHFMLKEIHEQPRALRQCLRGRVDELGGQVELEELAGVRPSSVQFVACGTSYHAALYGAELFREAGIPAQAFLASEYVTSPPPIGDALVVGVTQSGETADTLSALREARQRGARTLALTNVVGSTVARECDHTLYIRAGPEIGVAASKTFASQLAALNLFAFAATDDHDREAIGALRDLPSTVQEVIDDSTAESVAEAYHDADAYFFIGRGLNYPVALEGALKLKEITYRHAEGFAAGELKHGPLALVTDNSPVIAITTGDGELARKTVNNVKEVEARDAPVIAVTDGQSDIERYADHVLTIPETQPRTAAVLANVQLQLLAYHTADQLGRSIDKPRNLAKSVTVE
ncbi:glutamine--fructose-6-phosphate transaminase (isomerizing) [Halococcus thailandensis]|uniref:Glutamine--fructose-6-phosphate aminotransferase [isomerizing] n=1 Tax=Halococcus thailandensis JCM 13552 TaxID=1227457 RepID=M0N4V4_9EURY|nr:glutamine--fructose-6-phosphate transaminase (isomerizing) [Halococcus thailandensis]EMA52957.1 glucosamine/fructose-6-phosphate aminotransferase [Halococcus thailandensis JCM 13552]